MIQRWKAGAIFRIPIDKNKFCYGQMLTHEKCEVAIYDSLTDEEIEFNEIISKPVLFRVAVHKSAYNKGHWKIIGVAEVPAKLQVPMESYIKDKISGKYQIYCLGNIRNATEEECRGLECCAVWETLHVEDRIRCHYSGEKCIWLND